MSTIPPQATHQYGVFTHAQASVAGWSPNELSRAVRAGTLLRLRRCAYVITPSGLPTRYEFDRRLHALAGVAVCLTVARATLSHGTAAALHGLPLLPTPELPCVTLPPPLRTRPAGMHLHRQPIPDDQLDDGADVPVTSVARSCLDLTREAGLAAGVVTTDAALRLGLTTHAELDRVYRTFRGAAGLPSGRTILTVADGRSESPLESVSRLNMRDLPVQPELQTSLFTLEGEFIGRADFYWEAFGLVGEADGAGKYDEAELRREKHRQDAMTRAGLAITRWGWQTAMNPRALQAQLEFELGRAASLRNAGLAPLIRAERASCGPKYQFSR